LKEAGYCGQQQQVSTSFSRK